MGLVVHQVVLFIIFRNQVFGRGRELAPHQVKISRTTKKWEHLYSSSMSIEVCAPFYASEAPNLSRRSILLIVYTALILR